MAKDNQKVTIKGAHAYVVVKAAPDGIWVKNPWGPANSADTGSVFWIPKENIDDDFTDVSISAPLTDSGCF
ncbi:hypothetical protein [Gordonia sp. RS15-1S]|uniref:hypothetical protein n=1 Tax=Gordonia oryzae TaxID=2487349 RepID=UPI000F4ED0FB